MPARQPFTLLCQAASRPPHSGRADLHTHTTFSDGSYTPSEVVDLARRSGLAAVAITDHDTLGGIPEACRAALGTSVQVIPGVEVTADLAGREIHLLGYYVRIDDLPLLTALQRLEMHRLTRFWEMAERLRRCGLSLDEGDLRAEASGGAVGRRNLAAILVKGNQVGSIRDAFRRYLADDGKIALPKLRLPAEEAIRLVQNAGGVVSWAHPWEQGMRETLLALRAFGLQAVEAAYPAFKQSRVRELRSLAAELGLAITGGSDCHGPGQPRRAIGTCGLSAAELQALAQKRGQGSGARGQENAEAS
jgi:predicted metal-dependent phosphoesterase TrpH